MLTREGQTIGLYAYVLCNCVENNTYKINCVFTYQAYTEDIVFKNKKVGV